MRPPGMRVRTSAVAAGALSLIAAAGCIGDDSPPGAPRPPGDAPARIVLTATTDPDTSQAVAWRTAPGTRGSVQVRRAGSDNTRTVDARHHDVSFAEWSYESRQHTAVLRGLRPDTRYRYRVGSARAWSGWLSFRTAQTAASYEPWKFAYFGDAQKGLTKQWPRSVDRALDGRPGVDLMVQVGDLVDAPTDDGQWSDWFRALAPYRQRIDTLGAVGNHELIGDPDLEQYRSHFRFPSNGPDGRDETTYVVDYQGVRFIVLDSNHLDDADQRQFLQRKLRRAGDRWTVVVFHRPIFAIAAARDSTPQREAWLDTLERYDADLVLQGHDHAYARGRVPPDSDVAAGADDRPVYAVSVAGGKYYPIDGAGWAEHGARLEAAAADTSTYQLVRVTPRALTYRSVVSVSGPGGETGETIDRFRLTR